MTALAWAAVFLMLDPTLRLPLIGDDAFNAYLDAWMRWEHLSLADAFRRSFVTTNVDLGRFFPLYSVLLFFNYHFVRDPFAIKELVAFAVVLNTLTLYALLRVLAPAFALPSLAILPAFLQMRLFYDPIVQDSLHSPLLMECTLVAALGIVLYARTLRPGFAIAGVVSFALAAFTYEIAYAFVVPFWALAAGLLRDRSAVRFLGAALVAIVVACAAFALWFRVLVGPGVVPAQYVVHADPLAMLRVVGLQTLSAIPLSYLAFNPQGFLPPASALWLAPSHGAIGVASIVCCTSFGALALTSRDAGSPKGNERVAVVFALLLALASTAMISLSPRWQAELRPGLGYVPVYVAEFALAVVAAAALVSLARRMPRALVAGLAAPIVAFTAGTTYAANELTVAQYAPWNPVVARGLDAGMLAPAGAGAFVYLDDSYPPRDEKGGRKLNFEYYLFAHAGKRLRPESLGSLGAGARQPAFAVMGEAEGLERGRAAAGPIADIARVRGLNVPLVLSGRLFSEGPRASKLTAWRSACGPVPLENLVAGFPSGLFVNYDDAFSFPERDGAVAVRWAGGTAHLLVTNPSPSERRATLTFTLRTANPARRVTVSTGGFSYDRKPPGGEVVFALPLRVPGRAVVSIRLDSDNATVAGDPGGRSLRYEVRGLRFVEPGCGTLP